MEQRRTRGLVEFDLRRVSGVCAAVATAWAMVGAGPATAQVVGGERAAVGEYAGYSAPVAEEWVRESVYITVRDGTRLAADLYFPAEDGARLAGSFPVLWAYDRYHRANVVEGEVQTKLEIFPYLAEIVSHGYVIADVDARGAGASFGTQRLPLAPEQKRDTYDVTEWLADQAWSTGRIGMWGGSYLGGMQYLAAAEAPPSLVAIFPQMAPADAYDLFRPGGIFLDDFTRAWAAGARLLDVDWPAPPVDADPTGVIRDSALAEHGDNIDVYRAFSELPFRNSHLDEFPWPYPTVSPLAYAREVERSGVAVYHLTGWRDIFARDPFLWYWNLPDTPQKLIIGPWSHQQSAGLDYAAEHLRWYDFWLKGIENGVMDEAPIHYRTIGDPSRRWKAARQWPPEGVRPDTLWLTPGSTGTVASVNDDVLTERPGHGGLVRYPVDTLSTAGQVTRWTNAAGAGGTGFAYADLAPNDATGVTWTGAPLDTPLVITGHPRISLRVASSTEDADVFVYLEAVAPGGGSAYVTEGQLRLSLRTPVAPPHRRAGLPYRRAFAVDRRPLAPGEPVDVVLDLLPVSYRVPAGHRLRVTLTGADRGSFEVRFTDPIPTLTVHTSAGTFLELPVEGTR